MKAQNRKEANQLKKKLIAQGKQVQVYKFASKRKFQFFVGNWWEWLAQIS